MFCISLSGHLKNKISDRFNRKSVPTQRGMSVDVENVVCSNGEGSTVVCRVYIPESFGSISLLVPCVWSCNQNTPAADMYALPTWLQLACKPYEFILSEMEHPWDLIPVMVTICMRTTMVHLLHQNTANPSSRVATTLLVDAFDHKYERYNSNAQMAIDDMLITLHRAGQATPANMTHFITIGGHLLRYFFGYTAYDSSDIWQSAVNNTDDQPSDLMFYSNMSDVRCKIIKWMCDVEDTLRANSPHTWTIMEHASRLFQHTHHVLNHYDNFTISSTTTDGDSSKESSGVTGGDACDGDNAPPSATPPMAVKVVKGVAVDAMPLNAVAVTGAVVTGAGKV